MGVSIIIGAVIINIFYHKFIKRTPTVGGSRIGVEWFACLMISAMICSSLFD